MTPQETSPNAMCDFFILHVDNSLKVFFKTKYKSFGVARPTCPSGVGPMAAGLELQLASGLCTDSARTETPWPSHRPPRSALTPTGCAGCPGPTGGGAGGSGAEGKLGLGSKAVSSNVVRNFIYIISTTFLSFSSRFQG